MTYPATQDLHGDPARAGSTGLARITVQSPQRRMDLALPDQVPLAELLPEVLDLAGIGLADDGQRHDGWVLRRPDGTELPQTRTLHQLGTVDGSVLHLVPARLEWPELAYDDVVEAVAAAARQRGAEWSGATTRRATLIGAGLLLLVGAGTLLTAGPGWPPSGWVAIAAALVLLVAGSLAARAYGAGPAGATLGGFAVLYAFAGVALLLGGSGAAGVVPGLAWLGDASLLAAAAIAVLVAALGAVGVGYGQGAFAGAGFAGLLAAATALLAPLGAASGAAVLLAALVAGVGVVPLLVVRLARVPLPPVTGTQPGAGADPAGHSGWGVGSAGQPDPAAVGAAVSRADDLLTGILSGHAALIAGAVLVLVAAGGTAGRYLVAAAGVVLLLRARLFVTPRHRTPLLLAAAAALGPLAIAVAATGDAATRAAVVTVAVGAGLASALAGHAWSQRLPSPYLARAADVCDLIATVAVVPLAAWVLGIYQQIQGWLG